MYNRYVPQSDGSYQRNRMQDTVPKKAPPPPPAPPPVPPIPPCAPPPAPPQGIGIGNFFRQLLPQGLDTADLLIILLILLMAGDCEEDRNYALLTLALYFFM
ncbi:MAG: hypothetical protein IKU57_03220 [Oscillospiraceae bacterium]|nr:hypothetical protein [Oscillospiraceae bacterium]